MHAMLQTRPHLRPQLGHQLGRPGLPGEEVIQHGDQTGRLTGSQTPPTPQPGEGRVRSLGSSSKVGFQ